jgi:hypothetical protein
MDNLKQLVEVDTNPTLRSSEIIIEVFSETFNPELILVPSSRKCLYFILYFIYYCYKIILNHDLEPAGSRLLFTPAEDAYASTLLSSLSSLSSPSPLLTLSFKTLGNWARKTWPIQLGSDCRGLVTLKDYCKPLQPIQEHDRPSCK